MKKGRNYFISIEKKIERTGTLFTHGQMNYYTEHFRTNLRFWS